MLDLIPSPLLLGLLMLANYLIIAVNMRALAHVRWAWIAATDVGICVLNFAIIPRVATAQTYGEMAGYTVGGTLGALAGVWLSQHWNKDAAH